MVNMDKMVYTLTIDLPDEMKPLFKQLVRDEVLKSVEQAQSKAASAGCKSVLRVS